MGDPHRVEDLEVKVAFLEKHVGELDQLIRGLFDDLGLLRREITVLRETVRSEDAVDRTQDKPPHY